MENAKKTVDAAKATALVAAKAAKAAHAANISDRSPGDLVADVLKATEAHDSAKAALAVARGAYTEAGQKFQEAFTERPPSQQVASAIWREIQRDLEKVNKEIQRLIAALARLVDDAAA